jgi:hypothetical protein
MEYLKMPAKEAEALFDGRDHQNVPKPVWLLQSIYRLNQSPEYTTNIANRAVVLLAELLGCLIFPYISPSMTLSDQLVSLSAAVHIFLILYRIDPSGHFNRALENPRS